MQAGYALVIQDVRGRHASEGAFDPMMHETRDGVDTFAWAAAQPWSQGVVGTFIAGRRIQIVRAICGRMVGERLERVEKARRDRINARAGNSIPSKRHPRASGIESEGS